MYENTFSTDKNKVIEWAKQNSDAGIEMLQCTIAGKEADLAEFRKLLAETEADRARLELEYPSSAEVEDKNSLVGKE